MERRRAQDSSHCLPILVGKSGSGFTPTLQPQSASVAERAWAKFVILPERTWIQQKVRSREIELQKILGTENPADVLTKYVNRDTMTKALAALNLHRWTERPACAPMATGA